MLDSQNIPPTPALDRPNWIEGVDTDGTIYAFGDILATELVRLEAHEITEADGTVQERTYAVTVHNEPPLTAAQVREALGQILAALP
ncbi:MAG: hypothetical protein Q8R60_08785 [Mycobacteriales bacterium]|nr:hypothetical protein [Mycobacteriales bacterium]